MFEEILGENARHQRHAKATRIAVEHWGLEVLCQVEEEHSPVLTGVLLPDEHDADHVRNVILDSVKPEKLRRREKADSDESWIARYGITKDDLEVLRDNVAEIEAVVPMRIMLEDVQANLETVLAAYPSRVDASFFGLLERGLSGVDALMRVLTHADEAGITALVEQVRLSVIFE